MKLTRDQAKIALDVHNEMREMGIPELVTTREAYNICQDYDLEGKKYNTHWNSPNGVRSIDLAVYIARRTVEANRAAKR